MRGALEISYGGVQSGYHCAICGDAPSGRRLFTIRDGNDGRGPSLCQGCAEAIACLVVQGGGRHVIRREVSRGE